jgi:hypothetical protein
MSDFKKSQNKILKRLSSKEFENRIKREDETMIKYIPLIKKINKKGFLTIDSQQGAIIKTKKYKILERGYISGFMLENKAVEFIKKINILTDKNALYIPYCKNIYIPPSLDIPLTIVEKNNKILIHTHMSSALSTEIWNCFRKEINLDTKDVVFIHCWDNKWGRLANKKNGLFTEIIKYL